MSDSSPVRCGVVGVGYLGQHHARIYHELPQCELVGIVEPDADRAKKFCKKFKCKSFDTPEALAEHCDALSIAVPTDKHHAVALPLLKMGKHLLIEKPICTSLAEAEDILSAAEAANVIVQVGHIEHYNPVMSFLEEKVSDPRYITSERLAPFNERGTEVGVVLDLMIHDIGVVLQLVDSPVKSVESVGVNVVSKTEDIGNARIEFENGCVANLNVSRVSMKKVRKIRVFQRGTYLSMDFMDQEGALMSIKGEEFKLGNIKRQKVPIEKGEPLKIELSSFIECVAGRAQPKVPGMLGRQALELAIKITEQIQSRGETAS